MIQSAEQLRAELEALLPQTGLIGVQTWQKILAIFSRSNDPKLREIVRHNIEQRELAASSEKDGGNIVKPVGGVDFRAMPVMISPAVAGVQAPVVSVAELEKDWNGIVKQLRSGNVPYDQLKMYVAACAQNKEARVQLVQVTAYINNILRLEEDAAYETDPRMAEILAVAG